MNRVPLLLLMFSGMLAPELLAQAQATDPPMTLQEVSDFLGDTTLASNELLQLLPQAMARNGVAFSLDHQALETLLAAARKGRRNDATTSVIVLQALRSCPDCASTYFGPMNRDELLFLVRRDVILPHIKEEQVRLRGTKDVPKTMDMVRELQAAGATPVLIDLVVPFDEIEVPAPEGYQPLSMVRGADYDRHRENGHLDLSIDVLGRVELLFVNNALFYRAVPSADKKAPAPKFEFNTASNNAPAPADIGRPTLDSWQRTEEKGKVTKLWDNGKQIAKKTDRPPVLEFRSEAVPGRGGFYIMIDESDKKQAHTHDIRITWVKEPPAPAKPSLLK